MTLREDVPFTQMDGVSQAALVKAGTISARGLVQSAIDRILSIDPTINAIIYERFDAALEEATAQPQGPFAGVPILLKGLGAGIAGEPDHRGCQALRELGNVYERDSTIVTRLRSAGFIVLGRTNVPEFGLAGETKNRAYGETCNPWNTAHTPNGSSGGSAAAVASGMVAIAHASDAGGSIRMPASDCGLVGLKPTRGRVSHAPDEGEPLVGHLTSGVLTRTVRDTAAVLDVLAGCEAGDPTVAPCSGIYSTAVDRRPGSLRIGVVAESEDSAWRTDPACVDAVGVAAALLEQLGHKPDASYPSAMFDREYWHRWFDVLSPGVSSMVDSVTSRRGTQAADDFDPVTLLWAERGWAMTARELSDAMDWMDGFRRRMGQWWTGGHDLLLCPVSVSPAPVLGSTWDQPNGVADSVTSLRFCPQFNTTGQPAISIPIIWTDAGLPVGIQLVAPFGREDVLIAVAAQIEEARPWIARYPQISSSTPSH